MKKKSIIIITIAIVLIGFLTWRFIRPMNIFVVDDRFAWPVDTTQTPAVLGNLSAKTCGGCHASFYAEWQTAMHSQAWIDPYFQTDWQFDGSQHICRLCHTPLDRQQPHKVLGYRDKDKWEPVLEDNPDFDSELQHQGVTCAACHYRDGKIVGVLGNTNAPHPVQKLDNPNQVCVRCHIVEGDRWDTFYRFPPCGTVAEIEQSRTAGQAGNSGETVVGKIAALGCVECHMPAVERPLVKDGPRRKARQHLWRGGHDPAMVKKALTVEFVETSQANSQKRSFALTLTNTGAAHYVPTGTPDRYLSVRLRILDKNAGILEEKTHVLKRRVLWRPFIIDLWDNRLPRWQPRRYEIDTPGNSAAVTVEAVVRYHLLDEKRRKRIGYNNREPIAYEVYRKRIVIQAQTLKEHT